MAGACPGRPGRPRTGRSLQCPVQVRALALLLRERDLELHSAPNAEVALQLIAREPPYLAIVTDLLLPGINGQEMVRRIRGPRILALTGHAGAASRLQHFDQVLVKPAAPPVLLQAILGPDVGADGGTP